MSKEIYACGCIRKHGSTTEWAKRCDEHSGKSLTLYDQVLNAPDRQTRKDALDKLCREKVNEGLEEAAEAVESEGLKGHPKAIWAFDYSDAIRKLISEV